MKKLVSLCLIIALSFSTAFAQEVFTDHVQSVVEGQGTVVIDQDSRLDEIVNGEVVLTPPTVTVTRTRTGTTSTTTTKTETVTSKTGTSKRQRMRGFRIQVYWGSNTRADQAKAQRIGQRATSVCPELRAYTSFSSPHWHCRVGDFATREDANRYLNKLRAANIPEAMIVPSEVFILAH